MNTTVRTEERPNVQRIVIDELPRKTHDFCQGFNFSCIDEVTGRSHTSSIGTGSINDFRQQQSAKLSGGELLGKVAFYRDTEVESNPAERIMGNWVKAFHETLAMHCVRRPRYSELRPIKFHKFTRPAI